MDRLYPSHNSVPKPIEDIEKELEEELKKVEEESGEKKAEGSRIREQ